MVGWEGGWLVQPLLSVIFSHVTFLCTCGERIVLPTAGTYNNQYMVLDLKRIRLKEEVEDDALWVVEQVPG